MNEEKLVIEQVPMEIRKFFFEIFQLYEIRARVGDECNIIFEIRTRESNHNIPHVHAKYAEFEISISINDGKVLGGNLPNKLQKKAVNWINNNKDYLLKEWNDKVLISRLPLTKTFIETSREYSIQ